MKQMFPWPLGTPNTVANPFAVPSVTRGWAAGDAAYARDGFALADDEALVLKGRSPECRFWNLCLWNQYLCTYDYGATEPVSINGHGAMYDTDGGWTIIVSRQNPGGHRQVTDRPRFQRPWRQPVADLSRRRGSASMSAVVTVPSQ